MSANLILDAQRGARANQSRTLSDGTPSPAYMVEWVSAIKTDLLSGVTLRVEQNDTVRVQELKKGFLKHYAMLSLRRENTIVKLMPTC